MKFLRWSFILCLAALSNPLAGAELETTAPTFARKNEIKLFVTPGNTEQALKALKLDEKIAVRQVVCFFDTGDGALRANHLILRARQKEGEAGESTVKLRAMEGETELSDAERAIQPEQDWANENEPTLSRAMDSELLPNGLVPKVTASDGDVSELFDEKQQKMVITRMADFKWDRLKRYGPVETLVWQQHRKFVGFKERVTIELWRLEKDGRKMEILEVSTKVKAGTEEKARAMAKKFFLSARAAGLGEPSGKTKTQMVLEFFKPGR